MARPYQSAFKYLDYKEDANLNAHVKVCQSAIKVNGKPLKSISSMHLVIH